MIILISSPSKARLKRSRPVWWTKGIQINVNLLLLLPTFDALKDFFVVFSLESLIDNESPLELESEEINYILRTSWTPDFFVSRKVKLLKTIKTDSVINITRAYTEIFPEADIKKTTLLTHHDKYSSVWCVILKGKARCLKILRKTSFEFVFLG